mmetsp:Transcript_42446/g.50939  ORF Transcript_42446/g.50939 Transcript_42446/m.50939 type:complete len:366 (+) Transcript_42446:64-1161(+)
MRKRNALVPFALLVQILSLHGVNADLEGVEVRLVPAEKGNRCKTYLQISQEDCVEAAESLGGNLRHGYLIVGDWDRTPYSCFLARDDKAIHFNTNPDAVNNGMFEPVCIKQEEGEAYLIPYRYRGTKCISGNDVSQDDCIVAAKSLGGRLRNRSFLVGNWGTTPAGCFLEASDKAIHFGTNPDGVNAGYFQPVCAPGEITPTLLPRGDGRKCAEMHDYSVDECIAAGSAVGGTLRHGRFPIGYWSTAPNGCFLDPSDNAIHYGTNLDAVNRGAFEPVCKTVASEVSFLPAERGYTCMHEQHFSQEDCIVAAASVGGVLRRGAIQVGNWYHAPPGCFIESRNDNAIHYNRIGGFNNGSFRSVCKYA